MDLDAEYGISLLKYALEKEEDDLLYARWVQSSAHTVMSFDEFKGKMRTPQPKDTEAILEDVGQILNAFEAER